MHFDKIASFFSRKGGLIFSIAAAAGVVGTTFLAVRAVPKAAKLLNEREDEATKTKDILAETWTCFIPGVIASAATITCIFAAHSFDRHHQTAVSAAFLAVGAAYRDYRDKVKELYGEQADADIMTSIAIEPRSDVYISADSLSGSSALAIPYTSEPEVVRTFFDCFSRRYFEATLSQVIEAEYHLNRNMLLGGYPSVNNFYSFLGLAKIEGGNELSWEKYLEDDIFWIDFDHRIITLEDGMECCLIEMPFEPIPYE